ncbi:MAG: thioredoxin domain-containing protein [Candidatus Dojkabacteria bacterium]
MAKKDSKLQKFLKSSAILSGSGGIVGLILALSGICLPCVLVPLGLIGSILLFLFSFISDYRWWFLGFSAILLLLALGAKRVTVCEDGVCKIDTKQKKRFQFSFSNFKANLSKLNNWKTYVAIPVILLFGALLFTVSLSTPRKGQVERLETEQDIDPFEGFPFRGPVDAKVTIVEYSDYFCPPCLPLYEDVIQPTLAKYHGDVRFVSIQVNVLMDLSYLSTQASYCAKEQGKYWEMHEKLIGRIRPYVDRPKNMELYVDMKALSQEGTSEYFTQMAASIEGIDKEQYLKCMNLERYAEEVSRNTKDFQRLGFDGVPVLIINDRYFTGSLTKESLSREIDRALNR